MTTRREFLITTIATASSPLALQAAAPQNRHLPLRALPRVRSILSRPAGDGRLLLFTDGPDVPRKLIRPEALERTFGPGTDLVLQQPDHWRMIDEGWFTDDDLYEPDDPCDPAWDIWHANYRPETEAHDLLVDVFRDLMTGPFGARIPDLGLQLGEHPSTPRYATAMLDSASYLPRLAGAVAGRTRWLVIKCGTADAV